jgi:SAM-dependent methyltransferase
MLRSEFLRATLAGCLPACLPAAAAPLDQGHPKIDPAEVKNYDRQLLTVPSFDASGLVLDIGGGGEGVIAQLKGRHVVAIDLSSRELAEAPGDPLLKIIMDASDLKFLDASFPDATCFFSFMYMAPETQAKVMAEVFRVLQPGGRFLVWDVERRPTNDPKLKIQVFRFHFKLPDREIKTGYGTRFPDRSLDLPYYERLAAGAGFSMTGKKVDGYAFHLALQKPAWQS